MTTTPFRFLSLPDEIQDRILDLVLEPEAEAIGISSASNTSIHLVTGQRPRLLTEETNYEPRHFPWNVRAVNQKI